MSPARSDDELNDRQRRVLPGEGARPDQLRKLTSPAEMRDRPSPGSPSPWRPGSPPLRLPAPPATLPVSSGSPPEFRARR